MEGRRRDTRCGNGVGKEEGGKGGIEEERGKEEDEEEGASPPKIQGWPPRHLGFGALEEGHEALAEQGAALGPLSHPRLQLITGLVHLDLAHSPLARQACVYTLFERARAPSMLRRGDPNRGCLDNCDLGSLAVGFQSCRGYVGNRPIRGPLRRSTCHGSGGAAGPVRDLEHRF